MMIAEGDAEEEDSGEKTTSESAVLEVSSMATGGNVKQESAREDALISNYSASFEGSVVASPSIDSFSTLAEQDNGDFTLDCRDLQIKVDNPQKHVETLETFITFKITTRSTRPEFSEGEYIVRRRYNDFFWLRKKLVEAYPTHIIPPMPGKHTLLAQLDRYSKEFILARMKLLNVFLNRVVNHPIVSCDKNLHVFLTSKPAEFSVHCKSRGNVIGKVTDSLQTMTSGYIIKQRHLEFEQARDHCTFLSEKLTTIDKINCRIQKERQDYLVELHQLHPILTLWATSESELGPMLLAMSKAVELNIAAQQNLLEVSNGEEKEYIFYIDAVKDALARRDSMQIEFEEFAEELEKKRQEKDQLSNTVNSSGSQSWSGALWKSESRDEKLERLVQTIPRLSGTVEVLQDRLECANENLRSDLERWNTEKHADMKNMLLAMADKQISHYQQCVSAWEEVLAGIKVEGPNPDISNSTAKSFV